MEKIPALDSFDKMLPYTLEPDNMTMVKLIRFPRRMKVVDSIPEKAVDQQDNKADDKKNGIS